MKYLYPIITLLFLSFIKFPSGIDKKEAQFAFQYLNRVRQNPKLYSRNMPFLNSYKPIKSLNWNDTLSRVAETKALDMANRNYFSHVDPEGYGINHYIYKTGYKLESDWIKNPRSNLFESCNAGATNGIEAINMLLIDNGVPALGHRIHLLGLDEWSS